MLKPTKRIKIVPIKVDLKLLYENRHLFTDDSHYNSLVLSKLMNQNINLIDVKVYDDLDIAHKIKIYESNIFLYNYILVKDGLYTLEGHYHGSMLCMVPLNNCFIAWEDCDIGDEQYDILTIVNEE